MVLPQPQKSPPPESGSFGARRILKARSVSPLGCFLPMIVSMLGNILPITFSFRRHIGEKQVAT